MIYTALDLGGYTGITPRLLSYVVIVGSHLLAVSHGLHIRTFIYTIDVPSGPIMVSYISVFQNVTYNFLMLRKVNQSVTKENGSNLGSLNIIIPLRLPQLLFSFV